MQTSPSPSAPPSERRLLQQRLLDRIRAWQALLVGDIDRDRELLDLIVATAAELPYAEHPPQPGA